jgi:serine/threonine protein kinase
MDSGSHAMDGSSIFASQQVPEQEEMPRVEGYQVIEPLGRGGMGTVWRAVQLSTSREVALKLLGGAISMSGLARPRFEREVKLAARLEHSNIATIYDSGLERGVYYYAMQLVEGESMDVFVQRRGLKHKHILKLIQIVCSAVQHAHELGVVHRDLKPSNILVTESGKPIVLDFGLAKTVADEEGEDATLTMSGDIAGTPAFMAPEQAEGQIEAIGPQTDVYALGAILYRLLVGESPTDLTGTRLKVLMRIAHGEVRDPRKIKPSIDDELEAILSKALAVKPEDRYATAQAMAEAIKHYLKRLKAGAITAASDMPAASMSSESSGLTEELTALQTKVEPAGAASSQGLDDLIQASATFEPGGTASRRTSKRNNTVWLIAGGVAAVVVLCVVLVIALSGDPDEGQGGEEQVAGLGIDLDGPGVVPDPLAGTPSTVAPSTDIDPPPAEPQLQPESDTETDPIAVIEPEPEPEPQPEVEPGPAPEPVLTARDVVTWVIESGGTVTEQAEQLFPNKKLVWIDRIEQLPADPATINGVLLRVNNPAMLERLSDLDRLSGLKALSLNLGGTRVQGEDLSALASLKSIEYLKIDSHQLDGAVLDHIVSLPKLRAMKLHNMALNEGHFEKLKAMRGLTNLSIRFVEVTDSSLASIAAVRSLETLDLWGCKGFTSSAVRRLASMPRLSLLTLRETGLDDQGLSHLARSKSLETLSVVGTQVTPRSLVDFKRVHPDCILFVRPGEEFKMPEKKPDRDRDRDREPKPGVDQRPPAPGERR